MSEFERECKVDDESIEAMFTSEKELKQVLDRIKAHSVTIDQSDEEFA